MAVTDVITSVGTVGAVVAAVGIAWWGNRRSDRLTAQERKRADEQLRQERERSDRERRIERSLALLVEVYDLYADFKETRDTAALFKLHARLAVLPWTVATLIRFAGGETLLPDPDSKKAWVAHRAGRNGREVESGEVGWDLLKHEMAADVWFLGNDRPHDERRQWWFAYEHEHPPISGHASPGIMPPHVSGS
jgi:hypothetical protein